MAFVNHAVFFIPAYCISLFTSIVAYGLLFHELARAGLNGPNKNACDEVVARLGLPLYLESSRATRSIQEIWRLRADRYFSRYKKIIGAHPSVGPNEITAFHPDAFMAVDGPKSTCIKSEFYDVIRPTRSLVTSRCKDVHSNRRREWNRGFKKAGGFTIGLECDWIMIELIQQ